MNTPSFQDGFKLYAENKFKESLSIILPFAEEGNPKAQFVIGEAYLVGNGVSPDISIALLWFERSSAQDFAEAHYFLGLIYDPSLESNNIKNSTKDNNLSNSYYKKAFDLFMRDADKGDEKAMRWLGLCYQCAKGVPHDQEKMIYWFNQAFKNGCTFAANDLFSYYSNENSTAFDQKEALKYYKSLKESNEKVVHNDTYENLLSSDPGA
ncbi:MAG: tetratricopeptide repeat protein [Candidatus Omnitrophota bacterium]